MTTRQEAIQQGLSKFIGTCHTHGIDIPSWVNGGCVECKKDQGKKSREKRNAEGRPYHQQDHVRVKHRSYLLMKKYGITQEDYETMLLEQNSECKVCHSPHSGVGDKPMFIDHCHESGNVRGLLCHHCNVALGHIKDDVELATKLIKYLGEYV